MDTLMDTFMWGTTSPHSPATVSVNSHTLALSNGNKVICRTEILIQILRARRSLKRHHIITPSEHRVRRSKEGNLRSPEDEGGAQRTRISYRSANLSFWCATPIFAVFSYVKEQMESHALHLPSVCRPPCRQNLRHLSDHQTYKEGTSGTPAWF